VRDQQAFSGGLNKALLLFLSLARERGSQQEVVVLYARVLEGRIFCRPQVVDPSIQFLKVSTILRTLCFICIWRVFQLGNIATGLSATIEQFKQKALLYAIVSEKVQRGQERERLFLGPHPSPHQRQQQQQGRDYSRCRREREHHNRAKERRRES